jgi:hypothetical protein
MIVSHDANPSRIKFSKRTPRRIGNRFTRPPRPRNTRILETTAVTERLEKLVGVVQQIEDYAKLADTVASHLALKIPEHLGRHPLVEFHARFSTCSTEISLSISPSTLAVARKTAAMRWNVASDVILASCGASTGCPRIGRGD